jgi:hypothetical protein
MEAILIGYFPKRIERPAEWCPTLTEVTEICSVATCISEGPEGWMEQWRHNAMELYDSEDLAMSVVPPERADEYTMFAYKVFPVLFDEGEEKPFALPDLHVTPLPDDYVMIGYDAATEEQHSHSPLSCNSMADDYSVNTYCLMDDFTFAVAATSAISITGGGEPGPYLLFEVWRKQKPGAATTGSVSA